MIVYIVHTVLKGETLSKIAKRYNTTIEALQKANSIKNVNLIQIGQKLNIPNVSKDYEAIGKQFQRALNDVRNLPNVKKLEELIGE